MIKKKIAPTSGLQNQTKSNKRQKLSNGNCKKQQATAATSSRKQQQQSQNAGGQDQTEEPVWVYGLINNIEQMLSHLNAANNNQRLKEAVQQQQLIGGGRNVGGGRQTTSGTKSAKQANKSRPSNNSSGYSTPSSLYSTASLSPPFSSSSLAHCAYSSSSSSNSPISAQSPRQQQPSIATTTTTKTTITTNQKVPATNSAKTSQQKQQQQQQILPRSPLSRQIKFHEYKGPPQTRRPNNQQKQAQAASLSMPSGSQADSKGFIKVEPVERLPPQPRPQQQQIDCIEFGARPTSSLQTLQQVRLNPMPATNSIAACNQPTQHVAHVLAPIPTAQQQQCRLSGPSLQANQTNNYRMGIGDNCGQMMIVGQDPAQQINQTTSYMVQQQPNANQQQHVSLQLIRGANGQQQQVIVLDAAAFQQMQQQQNFNQKQQSSIILVQQEPIQQPVGGYSKPLLETNNGDDNNFQMHQTQSNAFSIETSDCLGDGQFQDNFLDQLGDEIANDDAYYRTQNQHQQMRTAPAAALRVLAHGQHFDAGQCQRGPISEGTSQPMSQMMSNYLDSNQFEQQPLQQRSIDSNQQLYATQQELYNSPTTNSTTLGVGCGGVELDCEAPDDTSEIEPTISFDGDLDHGMMYSEFIDSQDIPLNVDESDWLRKFLPPCTSS